MKPDAIKTFRTHDLYFAAFLKASGVPLLPLEPDVGNKVYFVFDNSLGNVEDLKTMFFNETGKIGAARYAEAIKGLKALVHMKP